MSRPGSRLSEKRREKLLAIKEREELKDALLDDIKSRFKTRVSDAKIQKEVSTFVNTAGLTLTNLDRLERRLEKREKRPSALADDDALSVLTGVSCYSAPRSSSRLGAEDTSADEIDQALNAPLGIVGVKPPSSAAIPEENGEEAGETLPPEGADSDDPLDWSKLDEYASILHAQDAYRVKNHAEEMKHRLRDDLDQQIADKRLRNQRQRDQDLHFHQERMDEVEKFKLDEEAKDSSRKERQAAERAKRDEMMAETERRKKEEHDKKIGEDRQFLAKIAKELDKERHTIIVRKTKAMERHKQVEEARIKDQIAKDEVKQKQLQEDLRMMREYQEMMMQQEIKRQEDLRKRVEKQKILQDRMEQTTHAVEANDKAEQEKVERERADIAARALELDRNKVEKQKKLTDETQAFLFQQMEGKADLAKRSQEQKLEAARLLEMDTKDYHDAEKLKADQRRAQNVAHRQELERQIALRSKPYPGIGIGKKVVGSDYAMSETEMRMNRNLVKQVKATLAENSARMGLTGLIVES